MPSVPCDACALRRVKCDGNNPCWICIKNNQPCTFLRVRRRRGPKGPRKSTKAKLEQLYAQLSLPRTDPPDQKLISLGAYFKYLDVYKHALYTTWPIVSIDLLKSRLKDRRTIDFESYALAAALSAATIVQLKHCQSEPVTEELVMEGENFVKECLRHRNQCNLHSTITINLLLTSLFLHMYYANTGQMNAATFALREAITYADLLRLGDPTTLGSLCRDERELRLRVYWVLFVTERTFCIQHRISITMQKINSFPTFLDAHDINPHSVGGFCELVRLFTYVETALVAIEQAPSTLSYSKKELQCISTGLDSRAHHLDSLGDLQIADIETTRAWLRSLLWQHAASRFMLESDAQIVQFTPEYPFHLARDLLSFLSKVQSNSIRAHAYSMEVKLSQIAHSLLDTIAVVPSIGQMRGQQHGPEHAVLALEQLLAFTAGGKSEHLSLLHTRMSELGVAKPSRLYLTLEDPTSPPQVESGADDEPKSGSAGDRAQIAGSEEIDAWLQLLIILIKVWSRAKSTGKRPGKHGLVNFREKYTEPISATYNEPRSFAPDFLSSELSHTFIMHRYSFPRAPVAHPEATVGGAGKSYRFTVLTDGLLRYEWADDGCFEDRASVLAVNRRLPIPEFRVLETDTSVQIITSRFHLTYDKGSFSPSGLSAAIKGFYGPHSSIWRYGNPHNTLGGTARTLDEINGRIELEPGIVARQGFATLDDSKSMLFDENGWLAVRRPGSGRVDGYLFAYGHSYREAVRAFYALSGPQPLLPRWALGNWWSRYYAYNAEEYLELMDRFREKGIPLSVAVLDMDWHIVDEDCVAKSGVTGWTGYTWNKALFPDPPHFLAELHRRGLKTSLNDHPADGVQSYEELYGEMARVLCHDTSLGDPISFDITNRAFLDAYFDVLHRHFDTQGNDLWWVDWQQGPHSRIAGIDPLWVLNHFHFLDSARESKRPLTFSRYAGPGSHRYPIGFSGDTFITWESLDFQPEFTATASNIGFGWWSHDIGGHMHGVRDEELLVRWVQYGVFSPILRLHSSNNQWNLKEPWMLDVGFERVMTNFLRLRHRLIPYLYTMNFRAAREGLPLVQPMYWEYPESEEAYRFSNQFLFGSELLVAPITAPLDAKARRSLVRAWFPPGRYVDIFTGTVYDGDRELWLSRPLASYPVFAREGSIIPLDGASEPANGGNDPSEIEILVVVGADGDFELVEDDGQGDEVDQITFRRTPISFHHGTGEICIGPCSGTQTTTSRQWSVRLLGCSSLPEQVHALVNDVTRVCQTEKISNGTLIKLGSSGPKDTVVVRMCSQPQLDVHSPTTPIMEFLRDAQIELDLKEEIWKIVAKTSSTTVRVGQLQALGLDRTVLYPILENLLADSRPARP